MDPTHGLSLCLSQQCTRCNKYLPVQQFEPRKSNGSLCLLCDLCRLKKKTNRDNTKCPHGRRKYHCKDCGGTGICEHGKHRFVCIQCNGSQICQHDRVIGQCRQCNGKQICQHQRVRAQCRDCGGSSFCEHGRVRCRCKSCNGTSICEHNRVKIICNECHGSQICPHSRIKSRCKQCLGGSICDHNRIRSQCITCSPDLYLKHIVSSRIRNALNTNKTMKSIEYLGCTVEHFKLHIESKMLPNMSWLAA